MQPSHSSIIWRIVRIFFGLASLTAVIWIVVWAIFFHDSDKSTQTAKTAKPSSATAKSTDRSSQSSSQPSVVTNQTQDQTSSSAATSQNNTTSSAQNQQSAPKSLVDTGPGDIITIFIGATILGTFGYHQYLRRQLTRSI